MKAHLCIAIASCVFILACLARVTSIVAAPANAAGAGRPNVILILADDFGWADLACYGHGFHETPNLDRLAAQGMRFTDAYAASCVCSPTRSSIMTGKYPARNDLTIWLGGRGGAPAVDHMALEEITIAEAMREHGYATAHVGKWHLGAETYFPECQGFDVNVAGTLAGSPAGGYFLPNKMNLAEMKDGAYLTDRLTDECVEIIEHWQEQSFFIYMAYHTVHTPIQGRKDLVEHYRQKLEPDDNYNPVYAAMVHCLDENVGRIMQKLDETELAERTVVIFFSDNGGFSHSRGNKNDVTTNKPLRLGKGYCYEGGHREPMIVRYPPAIKPGTVCRTPVISTDFYPTILELAGASPKPDQHADGVSIVSLLRETDAEFPRSALYWHYPHNSPQGGTPSGAIRDGDLKLIEFFGDDRIELYNLADDVGEQNDLSEATPDKASELHEKLRSWRESVDAKMPAPGSFVTTQPLVVEPTRSLPGFETLTDVAISKSEFGYDVAAIEAGLALIKPDEPLSGRVTFRLKIKPLHDHPANGFFVFGDEPTDKAQVKCGFFVGGKYAAVFEGVYPPKDVARVDFPTVSHREYDVSVTVDTEAGRVEMTVGDRRVTKELTRRIQAICYYGYDVIRTRSAFSAIKLDR
ncbi:MAG: sulfatase [Planctomycetes bacterium]|nr:sulfatase [Planctomycetota bacterium]MBL7038242.1 sulfatase [Pirellulaceae bacterium]